MKSLLCMLLCLASAGFTRAQPVRQPDFTILPKIAKAVSIACSPEGHSLAVAGSDDEIRLYRLTTDGKISAQPLQILKGGGATLAALAFKEADTLVSVSVDQTVKTWSVRSGELLHSRELTLGRKLIVAFAPGNQPLLAAASSDRVNLWNYESGALPGSSDTHDSNVSALSFTSDGKLLVIATVKGVVRVMDAVAGKVVRIVDMDSPIYSVAASADRIAVGYADGTIDLLNLGEQTSVPEIKAHQRPVSALAFSPKGDRIASSSLEGTVKVWDTNTRKLSYSLQGAAKVLSIVFSPDGQKIMTLGADGEVSGWSIR